MKRLLDAAQRERTLRYRPSSVGIGFAFSAVMIWGSDALGWQHVTYRVLAFLGILAAGVIFGSIDFDAAEGDRVWQPLPDLACALASAGLGIWWLW